MSTISRLNPTARTLAVYASQSGLLHTTQDSLPDGWPSFPGRVDSLLGPYERFQVTALIPSSFPKLSWRTPNLCPTKDPHRDSYPYADCYPHPASVPDTNVYLAGDPYAPSDADSNSNAEGSGARAGLQEFFELWHG